MTTIATAMTLSAPTVRAKDLLACSAQVELEQSPKKSPPPHTQASSITSSFKRRSSLTRRLPGLKASGRVRRSASMCVLPREENRDNDGQLGEALSSGYVPPAAKPIKSSLSVTNLADSLNSCDETSRRVSTNDCGGMKRNVSFHTVEFRHHRMTLGDNPSTIGGPPIQLAWKPEQIESLCLERYEEEREPRRDKRQMRIPGKCRENQLKEQGFSASQIIRAERAASRDHERRSKTNRELHRQREQELFESAGRKIKRIVSFTSKKKDQEKLWTDAQQIALEKQPKDRHVSATETISPPAISNPKATPQEDIREEGEAPIDDACQFCSEEEGIVF